MSNDNAGQSLFKRNAMLILLCAAALLVVAALTLLIPGTGAAPGNEDVYEADAANAQKVVDGCELLQTLTYTRCSHTVTRRVTAPVELLGKTLSEVEPMYDGWRITEFSPLLIKMEKRPEMHCPDHMVLMPNGEGMLCVFENQYGDALALVEELSLELSALPAEVQQDVRHGMGFSTLSELEQWLESVES